MSCKDLFDAFDTIPVWKKEGGKVVCIDRKTGRVLQSKSLITLPNGKGIEFFQPYKAALIEDVTIFGGVPNYIDESAIIGTVKSGRFKGRTIAKGTTIYVLFTPALEPKFSLSVDRSGVIGESIDLSSFTFLDSGK